MLFVVNDDDTTDVKHRFVCERLRIDKENIYKFPKKFYILKWGGGG